MRTAWGKQIGGRFGSTARDSPFTAPVGRAGKVMGFSAVIELDSMQSTVHVEHFDDMPPNVQSRLQRYEFRASFELGRLFLVAPVRQIERGLKVELPVDYRDQRLRNIIGFMRRTGSLQPA